MLTTAQKLRPHGQADYLAMKTATALSARLAGPTLRDVAARTRLDAGTISRCGNPFEATFVPVDVGMDLDALAGDDIILRTWARLRGYELTPTAAHNEAHDLAVRIGHAAREVGEMASTALEAMSDGVVTPREAGAVIAEANDAERLIASVKRSMHGIVANAAK